VAALSAVSDSGTPAGAQTVEERVPFGASPPAPRGRVAISGGELSRFGFLRVHVQCLEGVCGGRMRAGRTRAVCSGERRYVVRAGAPAVLRVRLKGTRRQLRRCRRILVTADTGPNEPPAAAFLPTKAVRYKR
jgi:hypothetical protein